MASVLTCPQICAKRTIIADDASLVAKTACVPYNMNASMSLKNIWIDTSQNKRPFTTWPNVPRRRYPIGNGTSFA